MSAPSSHSHNGRLALVINKCTGFFGPYFPIVLLYIIGLPLLSLSRVALALWQNERIAASGISLFTFLTQGIRADIIQVSILCVPLLFVSLILATKWTWRAWTWFSYSWILIASLFLVFLEVSTPSFISQYDFRPNRLYIEYLAYPQEVFATIWTEFRVSFLVGTGFTAAICFYLARTLRFWLKSTPSWSLVKQLCLFPVVLLFLFAGIRSTTDHRPANPALFALTSDPLVNSLIINSSWSVVQAVYNLKHESKSSDVYGILDAESMLKTAGLWLDSKSANGLAPTYRYHAASAKRDKPLNLVIILEESLGATFVESLGGLPVTPEHEKLKNEGWWFENLYATGTRSVRGIEAVVSGFLPTPSRSVVKLSLSQNNFFTIAGLLESKGYSTEFIYGGEAHFDNMRTFFTGNGFQSVIDQYDYQNPEFHGTWGVSDEDLFNKTHERLIELNKQGKPYFNLVFTTSNHSPFEYPQGRIEPYDAEPATVNNAVKYADYALGKFIEKAKTQDYWKDTLFLIVADHDTRAYGEDLVPIKNFHIPGLILGADITPKRIKTVASHVDLPTTMLSLMGISAQHPMIGRDLSQEDPAAPGRAFMQFADNYCLMEGNQVAILSPQKAPTFGTYDPKTKSLEINTSEIPEHALRALAYSHLPSWLYRNQLYPSPFTVPDSVATSPIHLDPATHSASLK